MNDHGQDGRRFLIAAFLLLVFAFGLLVAGRLHLPLLEPEEALYAVIPRDMLRSGEDIVPTLHGQPYLDKPPLLYWLIMGAYRLFGVHVWSARLIPASVAWLTVVVALLWGKARGGWNLGLISAAVLTLTGDFLYRGPMITPNGLLSLCTTAALALGQLSLVGPRVRFGYWIASAAFVGLAVLTKGPIGVVLTAGPLFVLPWLMSDLRRPGFFAMALYGIVVLLVAGPWFVAVSLRHPEFIEYFFWRHNVQRFTDPFDHAKPFYFYVPQLLLGALPWTLEPVRAVVWPEQRKAIRDRLSPDAWFFLAAAVAGAVFFSLAGSKRPVYLVPLWPPIAMGVAAVLMPQLADPTSVIPRRANPPWRELAAVLALILALATAFWLPRYHRDFSTIEAAEWIAETDPTTAVLSHPHPWNSLEIYLDGEGRTFVRDVQLDRLAEQLDGFSSAVVVSQHGRHAKAVLDATPAEWEVISFRDRWFIDTIFLRRRNVAAERRQH